MAIVGNTVRLTGQFVDFNGDVVTATDVKFIIYDSAGAITEITGVTANGNDEYITNYIVPAGTGSFNVKLYGLIDTFPEIGIISITREQ
jgi:hypothetical protein